MLATGVLAACAAGELEICAAGLLDVCAAGALDVCAAGVPHPLFSSVMARCASASLSAYTGRTQDRPNESATIVTPARRSSPLTGLLARSARRRRRP
jgi:hypothetical protein